MYLVSLSLLFRNHINFKSPQINIVNIAVDIFVIIICNMRYFKIILEP